MPEKRLFPATRFSLAFSRAGYRVAKSIETFNDLPKSCWDVSDEQGKYVGRFYRCLFGPIHFQPYRKWGEQPDTRAIEIASNYASYVHEPLAV